MTGPPASGGRSSCNPSRNTLRPPRCAGTVRAVRAGAALADRCNAPAACEDDDGAGDRVADPDALEGQGKGNDLFREDPATTKRLGIDPISVGREGPHDPAIPRMLATGNRRL